MPLLRQYRIDATTDVFPRMLQLPLQAAVGGRMAEWYWMGRQRPYCCGFESRAPYREGGHVTVMLRGVLIGWFDPGWQVFHLS